MIWRLVTQSQARVRSRKMVMKCKESHRDHLCRFWFGEHATILVATLLWVVHTPMPQTQHVVHTRTGQPVKCNQRGIQWQCEFNGCVSNFELSYGCLYNLNVTVLLTQLCRHPYLANHWTVAPTSNTYYMQTVHASQFHDFFTSSLHQTTPLS